MKAIKIERGIKPPKPRRGRKPLYPWADLKVGESFLAENKSIRNFRGMASNMGRTLKRQYQAKEVPEGVRVWRVA